MLKEIIFLDKSEYEMNGEDLFYGVLAVVQDLRLRLDAIDYVGRRVVIIGNIKAELKHDMIKRSNFGGKVGLYLAFPLMAFSKSIYYDRLVLAVSDIADKRAALNFYGRLNYGNVGSPKYAKLFNVDFDSLVGKLRNVKKGVMNGQVIADMEKLMTKRTIFALSWVTLLTFSTFIVVVLYLIVSLF